MKHTHHKIPKHAGGTDDQSNLVEVSIEEHAELHFALYLEHGRREDWCAYRLLSGLGTKGALAVLETSHSPEANAKRRKTQTGKKRAPYKLKGVNKGWGKSTGRKPSPVKYGDETFASMKECAMALGIHLFTAYRWKSEGKLQ